MEYGNIMEIRSQLILTELISNTGGRYSSDIHGPSYRSEAWPHLKHVLGDAREAVIGNTRRAGAHTDLTHLVRPAEVWRSFWSHHTHQR